MFFIKNRALAQAVRSSRNLFKNDTKKSQPEPQPPKPQAEAPQPTVNTGFVMTSQDLSKPYPYKFGGVTSLKPVQPAIQGLMPNNKPNFFQMYLELLKAVQKKNHKAISNLVDPELVEPLLNRNVKLINESSSGIYQYNSFASGFGVQGPRNPKVKMNLLDPPNEIPGAKQITNKVILYMPQSPLSMFQTFGAASTSNFPILMSAVVTVKSKACLIQADSPEKHQQQSHVLTFQRQAELNVATAMSMMSGLKIALGGSLNSDKMKSVIYGVQHPWKIANIDHFLKDRWQE